MSDFVVRSAPILDLPRSAEILIEGGVNAQNAAQLKEKIDKVLGRGLTYVSILMKNVSYVNSSGLAYLMELAGALDRRGGALVLVEVQPKVKLVFSNLGMQNYFRLEAIDENARAYLRAQHERVVRSPRVVLLDGAREAEEVPILGTSIRIGGDPKCAIHLRHPQVDPRHAEIYRTGDQCFVKDLGTRFGTWVGERRVSDEPLRAGDVIRVGGIRLAFYPASARKS